MCQNILYSYDHRGWNKIPFILCSLWFSAVETDRREEEQCCLTLVSSIRKYLFWPRSSWENMKNVDTLVCCSPFLTILLKKIRIFEIKEQKNISIYPSFRNPLLLYSHLTSPHMCYVILLFCCNQCSTFSQISSYDLHGWIGRYIFTYLFQCLNVVSQLSTRSQLCKDLFSIFMIILLDMHCVFLTNMVVGYSCCTMSSEFKDYNRPRSFCVVSL